MEYDDIVIGSGLTALGTVLGLPPTRRVLVLAGAQDGGFRHYPNALDTPCAYLGPGGLGQFWHGVIPTGLRNSLDEATADAFEGLFRHFYPRSSTAGKLHNAWLFVPWRPIRPGREWFKLLAKRQPHLALRSERALRFERQEAQAQTGAVHVHTASARFTARRIWLAAGCLDTPGLLERSLGPGLARDRVSDHVIIYLGQIDRGETPDVRPTRVQRTTDGMWIEARYANNDRALCTLRPARLSFAQLDVGIAQRAIFGLPAGSAVRKLLSGASPALIAEALYTRLGLFPGARRQSVYAQFAAPDAYYFDPSSAAMRADLGAIRAATDEMRSASPWPGLRPSKRPELYLPGIHLHHTLHRERMAGAGVDSSESSVQIVDASAVEDLGPDHHSFKLMLSAQRRASLST